MRFKHIKQSLTEQKQQLDEVNMSPGALMKFAASDDAKGIQAGFEAELIFRNTQGDGDGDDYEADYDSDERCYSIDQVVEFFENDDYGYGLSSQRANRLRNDLDERWYEWHDEQVYEAFRDEQDDLVREQWLDERPMTERIYDALTGGQELSDSDADRIISAGNRAPKFKNSDDQEVYAEEHQDYERYLKAVEDAEAILEEDVETSIKDQDSYYDQALENFRDNFEVDDSNFFSDVGLRWMSSVASDYDLDWPIMSGGGGNGGEREWSDIAGDLAKVVDMRVDTGHGYHSTKRTGTNWIVEPDSSLDPDDREDYGLEIVSPPMPLLVALEKLDAVIDWANTDGDAYTNSSTGLHMGVSVPYKGGDVDYVKLVLFMGDQYILEKFGRQANHFCDGAVKKLKQNVNGGFTAQDKIASAMELMKNNLIELAQRYVQQGVGTSKYTSAHIKNGYIEFRSPGGDYLSAGDREITVLRDTMIRFAYAMHLASRPDLERPEYYKKLYKLISPEGNKDLEMFAKFSSGEITAEQLKKQWADKVVTKEVPDLNKKSNWKLFNRDTGLPVTGMEFSNFTEQDALERAKAKMSPGGSVEDFKRAYELRDVGTNTGKWRVYRRENGETLEIIDAETRGEAADKAYDTYTGVIDFAIEPYGSVDGDKPKPKLSRRAELAKRIRTPKTRAERGIKEGEWRYQIVNPKDLEVVHTTAGYVGPEVAERALNDWSESRGVQFKMRAIEQEPHAQVRDIPMDVAQNIPEPQSRRDQLDQHVRAANGVPMWEVYERETGHVVHSFAEHNQQEAWRAAQKWLRDIGAEDPSLFSMRSKIQ